MARIIDTAISGRGASDGKAYFFKGDQYLRYDWNAGQVDEGYPRPIDAWSFPDPFAQRLDAALNGAGSYEGKAYFFSGDQYLRYDWNADQFDEGFPQPLAAWGLPEAFASDIDAALTGAGAYAGKAYFFKGDQYARYDWATGQVDFVGALSAWQLPSPCSSAIDAALEGQGPYAGNAYFFRHGVFARYDWGSGGVDAGYPAGLDQWDLPPEWLYPAGSARDHMWYVMIDDTDYFQRGDEGHLPNLSRLQEVAAGAGIQVDPIWMPNLRDEFLADETLLALFSAGSFPEWFAAADNSAWALQLQRYGEQIINMKVPLLAVCGSHQLVARTFADWTAIGHMMPAGQPIPTVADELEQHCGLIPQPRLGEVGVFPLRRCANQEDQPLFAGIAGTLWGVEHHFDQVIDGNLPMFTALLEADLDEAPAFEQADSATHRNPATFDEVCQVQALQLDDPGRVLYSIQFHPELVAKDASVAQQSAQLLLNFIDIARAFWAEDGNE
jgi:GMP synthase-like glutamine amidotransferase